MSSVLDRRDVADALARLDVVARVVAGDRGEERVVRADPAADVEHPRARLHVAVARGLEALDDPAQDQVRGVPPRGAATVRSGPFLHAPAH